MDKSEFGRVNFGGATLERVTLTYSHLARADFREAALDDVDLTGSHLYLTNFKATDLSRVKGLTFEQISLACGDDDTVLPESIEKRPEWRCID